jgi:hypothetical protein
VRDVGKTFCGFRKKHGALQAQGHANRTPTPLCRICPPSNTTTRLSLERFFTFVMTRCKTGWLLGSFARQARACVFRCDVGHHAWRACAVHRELTDCFVPRSFSKTQIVCRPCFARLQCWKQRQRSGACHARYYDNGTSQVRLCACAVTRCTTSRMPGETPQTLLSSFLLQILTKLADAAFYVALNSRPCSNMAYALRCVD